MDINDKWTEYFEQFDRSMSYHRKDTIGIEYIKVPALFLQADIMKTIGGSAYKMLLFLCMKTLGQKDRKKRNQNTFSLNEFYEYTGVSKINNVIKELCHIEIISCEAQIQYASTLQTPFFHLEELPKKRQRGEKFPVKEWQVSIIWDPFQPYLAAGNKHIVTGWYIGTGEPVRGVKTPHDDDIVFEIKLRDIDRLWDTQHVTASIQINVKAAYEWGILQSGAFTVQGNNNLQHHVYFFCLFCERKDFVLSNLKSLYSQGK